MRVDSNISDILSRCFSCVSAFTLLMLMCCCAAATGHANNAARPDGTAAAPAPPVSQSPAIAGTAPPMSAMLSGGDLLIASNDGHGTEMCYWFKRCMFNDLFTFYKVGYRRVSRPASDPAGIAAGQGIVWLNSAASSDNIGPVGISGYADFVGGNHPWKSADKSGIKGKGEYTKVRTAQCDSVAVLADGMPLSGRQKAACRAVDIRVVNTLFDPIATPSRGASALSRPLIKEVVHYRIQQNSMAVDVTHTYSGAQSSTVRRYYGMQSMFIDEVEVMTPGGAYPTFTPVKNVKAFKKAAHPAFGRFVERNAQGWCQSTWLRATGLGTHYAVGKNAIVFNRSKTKSYHVAMDNYQVKNGQPYTWSGIYTWALPLVDNNNVLVTQGVVDDHDAIFIDCKRACSTTVDLPRGWRGAAQLQTSGSITVDPGNGTAMIRCSDAASAILIRTE